MKFSDAKTIMEYIGAANYEPNAWETDFMDSLMEQEKDLSDKQEFCLNRIYEKATGGGRYERRQVVRIYKKKD